jgi:hypothetical protein
VTAWHGCSIHPTNSCSLSITIAGVLRVLGHTKLGWRTRAYDSKLFQASAQAKRMQNYSLVAINDERIRTRFGDRKAFAEGDELRAWSRRSARPSAAEQ